MTTVKNTPLSLRFPSQTRNKLVLLSKASRRSQASLVTEAVDNFIANYVQLQEWQIEGVKQAMKEMDEGKWIDGDTAMEWFNSLGTDHENPIPEAK